MCRHLIVAPVISFSAWGLSISCVRRLACRDYFSVVWHFNETREWSKVNSVSKHCIMQIYVTSSFQMQCFKDKSFSYFQPGGISPPKKGRTKDDFYTFCSWVLSYTQYEQWKQDVSTVFLVLFYISHVLCCVYGSDERGNSGISSKHNYRFFVILLNFIHSASVTIFATPLLITTLCILYNFCEAFWLPWLTLVFSVEILSHALK